MALTAWLCILLQTTWCGFGPKTCDADKQAAETCAGWEEFEEVRGEKWIRHQQDQQKHPVSHDQQEKMAVEWSKAKH